MTEDDLFLDDEAEGKAAAEKPKQKKATGKKASAGSKAVAAKKPVKTELAPVEPLDESQTVSLMATSILVVCAFVVGFAAGGWVFGANQQPSLSEEQLSVPGATSAPGTGQTAPPLTQQQQGKGLPKGHPAIPGAGGKSTKTKSKSRSSK